MKKRIISILLVLCMGLALLPHAAAAYAWEDQIWIGGTPVNMSTNMTSSDWVFFPEYNILVLSENFLLSTASELSGSKDKAVIQVRSLANLTIQLTGDATIGVISSEFLPPEAADGISTYGIYAPETSLAIEGAGTLNIYSNANAIWCKDLRVEGVSLNCSAYRTAIRVMDSNAYVDKSEGGDMLVKSGATVTARTMNGGGIYPETLWPDIADYRDNGGAAILVSGSFTVENSIVTAENTCNKIPGTTSAFYYRPDLFYGYTFCSTILVWNDLTVSGSDASVTGRLENNANYFGDLEHMDNCVYSKLGAVVANKMTVKEGGTIEGFITTTNHSEVAQGLKSNQKAELPGLTNAFISRSGEGTIRSGIVNTDVAVEAPEYADSPYYATEDFSPTEEYGNHLEITIGKISTVYLRTTDSGPELSFQSDFGRVYSLSSTTIDLRDFSNSVFAQNGCLPEWGFPKIYVKSGDWTIIPPCETEADYCIAGGTLTIRPQDGMEYAGGRAQIEIGATLNIDGDGIAKNWDVSACLGTDRGGGTLRFVSGTVENASASIGISVYIIGGNINFNPIPIVQNVKNGDGTKLYKDVYLMGSKADELVLINTGEGTITPESSYYYPIGYDKALVVWTINDLPIKYVTVAPEDGETYNLISGGVIESLGNEYHSLVRAERYKEFVPNPNYRFYRNPDESVTMNAAGSINTYEIRLDSAFYGPYLISSTTDLDSSLRAEWSYQNENGEKVVVGGNSLTCTIDDLSDITNYRTYTCTVYTEAADGTEEELGSYSANVYVMRWAQPDPNYASVGQEVTFAVSPSSDTEWAAGFLSTLKWQVNKGTGWEDIPDSAADTYTVTITEENVGSKYRRVLNGYLIGNFDKHEASIYVEMVSPELSAILVPEITSQPQSIKIQENDTAKHALRVIANHAESYQWQKKTDGAFVDMEGEVSATLEVGVGDVGTYRCIVRNRFGETVSEEASVTKGKIPSCGTLSGGHAALGEKMVLGVGISNAPGDGSVSVKWQYSADDGATWVDVVSPDDRENISMNVLEMVFSEHWSDGTVIKRYEISSSSMTIQKTTADMDGWKVRCVLTDAVGVYPSNTIVLSIDIPDYTVTFDANGHGTAPAAINNVTHGSTVSAPASPTAVGYTFGGWYTDPACPESSKFDFTAPITQNTTLYAKWTLIPAASPAVETLTGFSLTYDYPAGSALTVSASVEDGHTLSYQWYSHTTDSNSGGTVITGATQSTYTFPTGKDAGTYYYYCVVTSTRTDNGETADTASNAAAVTVNPAPVSFLVTENDLTYDGTERSVTVTQTEGQTPSIGDGYSFCYKQNGSTVTPKDAGIYEVWVSLTDGNFQFEGQTDAVREMKVGELTIRGKSVTVSGITAAGKVYDGTDAVTLDCSSAKIDGVCSGDSVFVTAAGRFEDPGAGENKTVIINELTLSGEDCGNYVLNTELSQTTASAGIKARDITVTITPGGGCYGSITPAEAELEGLAEGDAPAVILTYTGTANDGSEYSGTAVPAKAGSYTVTASVSDPNYNLTGNVTAAFAVAKAEQAEPSAPVVVSKTYDSVTLERIPASLGARAQYSIDGGITWQDSPTFTGLKADTEYSFVVRYRETDNCFASPVSSPVTAVTDDEPVTYPPAVNQPEEGGSVTLSPYFPEAGQSVTVTPAPKPGYVVESITVTDPYGNPIEVTDNGSGSYSFTQPVGSVSISVTFTVPGQPSEPSEPAKPTKPTDPVVPSYNPFADVSSGAYYYDAVLWAVENVITGGTDARHFAPDASCTRAQAVTFLWRAAGCPEPERLSSFADVPAGSYYAKAVAWAVEKGITKGTGATTFSPDDACTRAQIVTFLWRAQQTPAAGTANPFLDVANDAYYAEAVLWAVREKITNGTSSVTFSPDAVCTRAQIVTFLWRCLGDK